MLTLLCWIDWQSSEPGCSFPRLKTQDFESSMFYASDGMESPPAFSLARTAACSSGWNGSKLPVSGRQLQALLGSAIPGRSGEGEASSLTQLEVVFPVINEGRLVAILALGRKGNGGSYTLEEEELVKAALRDLSARIDQAVKQEEMQAKQDDLTVLNRLMAILTSTSDFRDAFERFSEELKTVAPVDLAIMALADEDDLHRFPLTLSTAWALADRSDDPHFWDRNTVGDEGAKEPVRARSGRSPACSTRERNT